MPIVSSNFQAPALLGNGHIQTVAGGVTAAGSYGEVRSRSVWSWRTAISSIFAGCGIGRDRLAILSHGLEGSANEGYIRGMAATLAATGWDVLAWNFRGCGEEPNRLVRLYHSGATEDLRAVVDHVAGSYRRIALIGFSLGGNLTLKYMGEALPHDSVIAAVAISAPVDLAASAGKLDARWSNRVYLRRFIDSLVAKVEAKALRFPDQIDASGSRALRTFQEFDDRYTSRLHGFRDAADYWTRASARQFLLRITRPTLLLNARNDPFLAPECFPFPEAERNPCFFLEAPESGGHLGFLEFAGGALRPWFEGRVVKFLDTVGGES